MSTDVNINDDNTDDNDDNNDNYDNMTNDEISQKGKEKFFKTELMEKIIKYIKIDDSIKEKQKEARDQMKVLKTKKEEMEKYILLYLESINEEYVKVGDATKLTKIVSNTKGIIKQDNIKISISDSLKKENIAEDKINDVLANIIENIEKNRSIKTRTYIKRTKGCASKNIRKIAENNKDNDALPKYNSKK